MQDKMKSLGLQLEGQTETENIGAELSPEKEQSGSCTT